jgi:hypothetical protein
LSILNHIPKEDLEIAVVRLPGSGISLFLRPKLGHIPYLYTLFAGPGVISLYF